MYFYSSSSTSFIARAEINCKGIFSASHDSREIKGRADSMSSLLHNLLRSIQCLDQVCLGRASLAVFHHLHIRGYIRSTSVCFLKRVES